jgi:hypothetical protein
LFTAHAQSPTEQNLLLGQQVLTMAVLAILVTAPIGAALIAVFGPKLLTKEVEDTKEWGEAVGGVDVGLVGMKV